MKLFFGILGILYTLTGMLLPPIQTLLVRISVFTYFRQRLVRRCFYALGLAIVLLSMAFGIDTFSWVSLALVGFFILMGELVLVPSKLIPPLDNPAARSVQPADLPAEALVIGVSLGGLSHAYPLSLLIPHHILNDTLGGKPLAVTYCPACRSGYIFDPVVKGTRLTFEPVTIRHRNMVMRDRETGSAWQHETGTCLIGPNQDEVLQLLNSETVNWKTWVHEHPDTTVASLPEKYRHPSPLAPVFEKLLDHGPEHLVGPGLHKPDHRLDMHEFVIGILVDGMSKAYPLKTLVAKQIITDTLGGVPLVLVYEPDADRVRAFRRSDIDNVAPQCPLEELARLIADNKDKFEPIPVARQWWLAWSEYHPGTGLYI
jgi:hypothetical protein